MADYFTKRTLELIRYGDEGYQEGDEDEGGSGSGGHSAYGPIAIQPEIPNMGLGGESVFAEHPLFKKMPRGMPAKMSQMPSDNPVAEQHALHDPRCEHLLTHDLKQRLSSTPTLTR